MKKQSYWPTLFLGGTLCVAFALPYPVSSEESHHPNERSIGDPAAGGEDVDKSDLDQRRYRMGSQDQQLELNEETRNDIKDSLVSFIEYAVAGDMEDVIDHLSQKDEDRLMSESAPNNTTLERTSETFNTNWKTSNKDSFADIFDRNSLRVEFLSGISDKWGRVKVSDATESVELKLVNEGTLMDSWKIDAPDSLTRHRLQEDIESTLSDSAAQRNSQTLAVKVLRCLGQDNGTEMNKRIS